MSLKYSQADPALTLDGTELIGLTQNGNDVRATIGDIAALGADIGIPGSLNLRSAGAKADGVTNDNPVMVSALSSLAATALTGHGYGDGIAQIYIPNSSDLYEMGSAPIDIFRTVRIFGAGAAGDAGGWVSALKWDAGSHGYRVQYYNTTGDSAIGGGLHGGTGSVIERQVVQGGYAGTEGEYHGYFLRTQASLRDVQAWNWQGDGIHIHAGTGLPESGNANTWEIYKAWLEGNRNGVYVDGGDTNVGVAYGVNIGSARQWGFYDNAGIQNLYINPLTQLCGWSTNNGTAGKPVSTVANVAGTQRFAVIAGREIQASTNAPPATAVDDANWYWYSAGGVDAFNPVWFNGIELRAGGPFRIVGGAVILNGYAEGGQPPAQLGGATLRIGGTWGCRVIGGAYIGAGSNQVIINDIRTTAGGLSIDDDGLGYVRIGRYSSGAGVAILGPTAACSSLAITSPDNTQMILVANAGITVAGDANLGAGKVYKVNGTKVVGTQGAAVADAAALTSVDGTNAAAAPTQAEFNALVTEFNKLRIDLGATRTQLNLVLARIRASTGHGLIA